MANARKLKSGNYRVLAYCGRDENGKRIYKSFTAATKQSAEQLALAFTGGDNAKNCESMTVADALKSYINKKTPVLSPTTIKNYHRMQKHNMKLVQEKNVNRLTNIDIQNNINLETKAKSPKTLKNAYGLLSAALKNYRPDFVMRVVFPQKTKVRITIPSKEQIAILVEQAEPQLRCAILIACELGLRRSEISALDKSDFDRTRRVLDVNKAMVLGTDNIWQLKPP